MKMIITSGGYSGERKETIVSDRVTISMSNGDRYTVSDEGGMLHVVSSNKMVIYPETANFVRLKTE